MSLVALQISRDLLNEKSSFLRSMALTCSSVTPHTIQCLLSQSVSCPTSQSFVLFFKSVTQTPIKSVFPHGENKFPVCDVPPWLTIPLIFFFSIPISSTSYIINTFFRFVSSHIQEDCTFHFLKMLVIKRFKSVFQPLPDLLCFSLFWWPFPNWTCSLISTSFYHLTLNCDHPYCCNVWLSWTT